MIIRYYIDDLRVKIFCFKYFRLGQTAVAC